MAPELTLADLRTLPATVDVVTAARALGISRTKAYELAKSGNFPCRLLRTGHQYRVPTAELLRILGVNDQEHDRNRPS